MPPWCNARNVRDLSICHMHVLFFPLLTEDMHVTNTEVTNVPCIAPYHMSPPMYGGRKILKNLSRSQFPEPICHFKCHVYIGHTGLARSPGASLFLIDQLLKWKKYWQKVNAASTGWSIMTVKEYDLIAQARKQLISWIRYHFVHKFGTFWYLVSKKIHNFSVIIHLSTLLRCITVDICKIHWEMMIF